MSLKTFHIIFIAVSILLCFGFGSWLVISDALESNAISIAGALLSFASGIALIFYAKRFLHKFKNVSYL